MIDRRNFLKQAGITAAVLSMRLNQQTVRASAGRIDGNLDRKVIVIGIDGMDPLLSEKMMDEGKLPTFAKLRDLGGYKRLGTSDPPQSPVAWANFINGAGPGSHGIFDFIHRDPARQCVPLFSAAETLEGSGFLAIGEHKMVLSFWPFNHQPAKTVLNRAGVPFWDYLDNAGISSTFYNLPSNYPPSRSHSGHHRCLSGMGTPDLLGTYGTYQYFAEDGPLRTKDKSGGKHSMILFRNNTSDPPPKLAGPLNTLLINPAHSSIEFLVHRDCKAGAAIIEIQKHIIVLRRGEWSKWIELDFKLSAPCSMPDKHIMGICRFYLQETEPNFRLYVSPINTNPAKPAIQLSEPAGFSREISRQLGLFYTTGFQEDHKALSNRVFTDDEFVAQAGSVLDERMRLLRYARDNYSSGLLFFYFSSTDLQSHMFWWNSQDKHPVRNADDADKYFAHLKGIYEKLDSVTGDLLAGYGHEATVIVLSDHGFSNFRRQFGLNTWLKENGYIQPADATSLLSDVDWSKTTAFGLGINGLYLNLRGREKYGIVEPGRQKEQLLEELIAKLESVRDDNGNRVIKKVRRADKIYTGDKTAKAPDLIVGYSRDYRASWATCLGDMESNVLSDNDSAWSADHCCDSTEVPGVLFCNKPIKADAPSLIDIAPSILMEFGLPIPPTMEGRNVFSA